MPLQWLYFTIFLSLVSTKPAVIPAGFSLYVIKAFFFFFPLVAFKILLMFGIQYLESEGCYIHTFVPLLFGFLFWNFFFPQSPDVLSFLTFLSNFPLIWLKLSVCVPIPLHYGNGAWHQERSLRNVGLTQWCPISRVKSPAFPCWW